jgi:signal transduction histidine kinase
MVRRWWRAHPIVSDAVMAGALAVAVTPQLAFHARAGDPLFGAYVALSLAMIAPLIARRRWPLAVFLGISVVAAVQWSIGVQLAADVSALVALATVAAHRPVRETAVAVAIAEAGAVAASASWPHGLHFAEMLTVLSVFVLAATALGTSVRSHRRVIAVLQQQSARAEQERAQQTRLAVADERNRIARDMHDVIAHGLAVIVTLAAASTGRAARQPERVDEVVGLIERTARTALDDTRHAVGTIRAGDGLHPTPSIDGLSLLVDVATAAGLCATLRTDGAVGRVPAAVGVAVYRVTQEAITNTLKHANASVVAVDVVIARDALVLNVEDDGVGGSHDTWDGGSGVVGMRERVTQLGGTLDAGIRDSSGWRVRATIPLAAGTGEDRA